MRVTKSLRKRSLFVLFVSIVILIPAQAAWAQTEEDPFEGLPEEGQARFDALQERAVAARDAGDTETALVMYEEMQRLAPDSGEILYNRGTLHLEREEYDRAITLLSRAEEAGYQEAAVFYNRGNALFYRGQIEDAREEYRRARELSPEDPEILNNLGLAELRLEALDNAEERFLEAAERDESYPDPLFHLAEVYESQGLPDEAETALTEAIARSETFTEAFYNRGTLRYRRDDYAAAFDDFLEAHRLAPDDRDILYNLGVAAIATATERAPRIIIDEKE
ncbi:MAG: tetratricopeptide repeat protein [Alkalispirochaeta sp.]